jgi:hypothetical protein
MESGHEIRTGSACAVGADATRNCEFTADSRHSHSIVLHRAITLILRCKSKVITPKHRRPDRHNLSFESTAIFLGLRNCSISVSIDLNRVFSAEHISDFTFTPKPAQTRSANPPKAETAAQRCEGQQRGQKQKSNIAERHGDQT